MEPAVLARVDAKDRYLLLQVPAIDGDHQVTSS